MCGKPDTIDSIEHFPFCEHSQLLVRHIFQMPTPDSAPSRHHYLQDFFALGANLIREDFLRRLLLIHTIYTLQNLARHRGSIPMDRVVDRGRTLMYRAAVGSDGCRRVAEGLLKRGALHRNLRTLDLPEVPRRRPVPLPPGEGGAFAGAAAEFP